MFFEETGLFISDPGLKKFFLPSFLEKKVCFRKKCPKPTRVSQSYDETSHFLKK
jgi:hypothetical protein